MNIKLLKGLDFAAIIRDTKAVTESGREMVKNYAGYLFSNEPTYGIVNGFVQEARAYTYDNGVMEGLQKVASYISENKVSWQLASACEGVSSSRPAFDYITKNAVAQVNTLLESLDENQVVQYIKAGALKNIQYIPEFRAVCKSVYSQAVCEAVTPTYTLTAPVTFTESVDDFVYFSVLGRTYKTDNAHVMEAADPSSKFTRINRVISNMTKIEEGLTYTYAPRNIKFDIFEDKIDVTTANGEVSSFTESEQFNEWRDLMSRGMFNTAMKVEFMNVTESIKEVFENMDEIYECDSARVLRTSNGAVKVIVEASENIIVNTVSATSENNFITYDNIIEALQDIEHTTGVNLQTVFEKRIEEETSKISDTETREALNALAEAKIEERRKRIERLTEENKNNPMKLAILNKIAKELAKA